MGKFFFTPTRLFGLYAAKLSEPDFRRLPACHRQRAEAIKAFDEKLAKLGHKSPAGKHNKSHHKAPAPDAAAPPKTKPKA